MNTSSSINIFLILILHIQSSLSSSDQIFDIPIQDLCTAEPHLQICQKRAMEEDHHIQSQSIYRSSHCCHDPIKDRIYPGLTPKDNGYCSRMKYSFAWTCQPSKPLRIDLVEFCKDYSFICHVPNFHSLPGPRMGGVNPRGWGLGYGGGGGPGRVDVSGNFNFGIGAVPGLEVDAGWGVDVGPIPGMDSPVGVNTGIGLGLMGSSKPELYRRGQGNGSNGGGLVGVNGGVGVG